MLDDNLFSITDIGLLIPQLLQFLFKIRVFGMARVES
jgi:hypothetical protein